MTHMIRSISRALAALTLVAGPLAGQVTLPSDNTAYGTTAGEFLLLGAGARGLALGGAYAALATDVSALYYNPAGAAQLERPGALVTTYSYAVNTRYVWAGLAVPMSGGARTVGLQIGNFGFSGQPVYTVENPDGDGTKYSVAQTFAGLSYAQNFSDRFSAGGTFKVIYDALGNTTANAVAVDFGTNFHAQAMGGRPLRVAFVILNLGSDLKHQGPALDATVPRPPVPGQVDVPQEEQPSELQTKEWGLPIMFRVSASLDAYRNEQTRVTVLSEFTQPNNNRAGFAVGGEFALSDLGKTGISLAGRGSWTYQADNNLDPGAAAGFTSTAGTQGDGLAAGFGVSYQKPAFGLGLDYGYRSMGLMGGTNMLTFSVSW